MILDIQFDGLKFLIDNTYIQPGNGDLVVSSSRLNISLSIAPLRYLYSGWQSWSLSAWVDVNHPVLPMRPLNQQPRVSDPQYVKELQPNGSWYSAVECPDGHILFLGALGLESHVMLDGQTLSGLYESGDGEWFLAYGDELEIMTHYSILLGERLGIKQNSLTPYRVWCSWYSLYSEIHETQLLKILTDLGNFGSDESLPFDVFQIDDGWQVGIGDWEPNNNFPSGMTWMASRVRETGRKAGLWLAPLLVVPSSSVYKNHRDWLLHDEAGKLVSAGFNWGEQLYALDTTHPSALNWLIDLMLKVRQWGYEYVKLDFLYAGALPGKRYVDIPRETAYRLGLNSIRKALKSVYLLACGAPILPSIGVCDGIRIGPDVAEYFTSHLGDNLLMNFAFPGVRNVLRTSLNRIWLQHLVHIDPDVVYFRSCQNKLTPIEKSVLQDLAYICNFKACSDIPAWLSYSERSKLKEFLENKPISHQTGRTTFQIGPRKVDFSQYISMPTSPDKFTNLQGVLIGRLADIPSIVNAFDLLGKYSRSRILRQNPV